MKISGVDPMPDTFFDRKKCCRFLIVSNPYGPEFQGHLRS
jgi:hypothetical protein